MGFSWVQDISIGSSIDTADVQEIRTNTDTTDSQKCKNVNSSVLTGQDVGAYTGAYAGGVDFSAGSSNSGADSPVDSGADGSANPSNLGYVP